VTTKAYRGRYLIIAKMLSIINDSSTEGANKTSIMYKSYISYAQLKEYLSFMVEKGLVEEIPHHINGNEKFVYKITEKGICLMQISKEIENIVGLD
jgi:predicted transcriptional regulator